MEFEPKLHAVNGYCPTCKTAVSWTKAERRWQRMVQRPEGLRVASGIEASFICESCGFITMTDPDSLEAQNDIEALVVKPPPPVVVPVVAAPEPPPPPPVVTEADLKSQMSDIDKRIRAAMQR